MDSIYMRTRLFKNNLRKFYSLNHTTPTQNIESPKNNFFKISNFEESLTNIKILNFENDFFDVIENLTSSEPLGIVFKNCLISEEMKRDVFDRLYFSELNLNFKTIGTFLNEESFLNYPTCLIWKVNV
jgi:hypothetical protein